MPDDPDNFKAKWESLSDKERQFVLVANEINERLPHSHGLDKIIPALDWQDVALRSGVGLGEVDRLVMKLADMHFVMVLNSERRRMGLLCGHHLRLEERNRRRRVWNWVTLILSILAAILGFWCSKK